MLLLTPIKLLNFLKKVILDNYRIFNTPKLFKEFVARQEKAFVEDYSFNNRSLKLDLQGDAKEIAEYKKVLGITSNKTSDDVVAKVEDNGEVTLNSMVKKWM